MTEQAISPLLRRMIEDMSIRKFTAKTQHDYVADIPPPWTGVAPGQRRPCEWVVYGKRHSPIRAHSRGFVPWRFSDAGRGAR
jgi:hypothetical protein